MSVAESTKRASGVDQCGSCWTREGSFNADKLEGLTSRAWPGLLNGTIAHSVQRPPGLFSCSDQHAPPPSQAHPECAEGPQERGIASSRRNGVGGFPAAARITAPTPYAHRISAPAAVDALAGFKIKKRLKD
ncbi:unnamed protein product [Arctogadus glacialis]